MQAIWRLMWIEYIPGGGVYTYLLPYGRGKKDWELKRALGLGAGGLEFYLLS